MQTSATFEDQYIEHCPPKPSSFQTCVICFRILLDMSNASDVFLSRKKIRLLDMQTGSSIGIFLEDDNSLSLENIQLIYPNATTVKCVAAGHLDPYLFPCKNNRIESPIGIWPEAIYEPVLPSGIAQPWINLVEVHSRGYAPCQLKNPSKSDLFFDAELLIDCGLSVDLILPAREIEKLQLRRETTSIAARGFNNQISVLPQYEDVKITIHLKHAITGKITTKSAMISVFERVPTLAADAETQCSDEISPNQTQPTTANFSNLFSPPRNTPTIPIAMLINDDATSNVSILKLSRLKAPLQNTNVYGILGCPAMTKLNIGVHFGGNYIFSVERMFEYISSVSVLTND